MAKRDRLKICVNRRQPLGFTLIEQLAAILIVAVLGAIVLPSFLNQRDKAEIARAQGEARAISLTITFTLIDYYAKNSEFPLDVNQDIAPAGIEDVWVAAAAAPLRSPFDYDYHGLGDGRCLVQVVWFGIDQVRNTSAYSTIAVGDDRIMLVSLYNCDQPRRSIR